MADTKWFIEILQHCWNIWNKWINGSRAVFNDQRIWAVVTSGLLFMTWFKSFVQWLVGNYTQSRCGSLIIFCLLHFLKSFCRKIFLLMNHDENINTDYCRNESQSVTRIYFIWSSFLRVKNKCIFFLPLKCFFLILKKISAIHIPRSNIFTIYKYINSHQKIGNCWKRKTNKLKQKTGVL